jgi:biofilm PGA synthesis protein PgaA
LRRKRFREARERAEQLNLLYPGDAAVQRLVRDVDAQQAVELQINTVLRHESGNAANRPGSEVDTNARLYFPPFGERWRAFTEFDYSSAKPVEGSVHRIRYGAGAQAEWPDFTVEAIAWNNAGAISRGGGTLSGTWEASDQWSFSASGELFSAETPLRAVLHGITANSASFRTSYARNESFSASARMGAVLFSDGNQRLEGSLSLFRRLTDRPHLKFNIHPEFYASHNTRLDAPYFNPAHDASANLAFEIDHILWRRYERSFRQSVTAGSGPYWEAHFRPDWIGQVSYRQSFELQPGLEIRYGVDFARRVYDGQPVRDVGIVASLDKRFL